MLPTAAYVGGPAELAYFAQSQVLYERLLGHMPRLVSRNGVHTDGHPTRQTPRTLQPETAGFLPRRKPPRERIAATLVPSGLQEQFDEATWQQRKPWTDFIAR